MLVLSRRCGQQIIVDENTVLTVLSVRGNRVRIGIEAPSEIGVFRQEVRTHSNEPSFPGPAMSYATLDQLTSDIATDGDLRRRVVNFLLTRQVPGAPGIRIDVQDGIVILRGSLPSARAKRLCLECCRRVAGVTGLKDEATIGCT
jgi:carbon storage regulator